MKKNLGMIGTILSISLFFQVAVDAQQGRPGSNPGLKVEKPAGDESEKTEEETSLQDRFAQSQPEDITNENFPEIIESFDFPNADINDVIKAISELTGRNFIIDSNVKGKITIVAPSKITVAEAYKAFLSALASLGKTVVPSGKFWKIKDSRTAQRDSIETYAGDYFPNADQMITRIVKMKYISAKEVETQLRTLPSKDGEMRAYEPTNSLIITDYGSNITRIMKIIDELDVPGFEEKLAVIRIRFAKAKEIASLIDQIINKKSGGSGGRFGRSSSRFSRNNKNNASSGSSGTTESFSVVLPDDRTNSIIVVGNAAGIAKIRGLVAKLDNRLSPEEAGGVYVYYVRHGVAEDIAKTLTGIAKESKANAKKSSGSSSNSSTSKNSKGEVSTEQEPIFGGDVIITADKPTNSLIITAGKQDYIVVKKLLEKIDIPRDQVFVKVVIMEMSADKNFTYNVNFINLDENSNGIGRAGFVGSTPVSEIINPTAGSGAVLAIGSGSTITLGSSAGAASGTEVVSLISFINFLQVNTNANILSTPQLMALNNEEASIEVGAEIPVSRNNNTNANGTTSSGTERVNATILLEMTPFISPDSDTVRMKIKQQVKRPDQRAVQGTAFAETDIAISTRNLETIITAESGDTIVLGGLMEDQEVETVTKVPLLGDIPVLGWLFRSKNTQKTKTNLVMFITPKIIRSPMDSGDLLTSKINERIDFIQRHMRGNDPHGAIIDGLPRKASLDSGSNLAPEEPASETF